VQSHDARHRILVEVAANGIADVLLERRYIISFSED